MIDQRERIFTLVSEGRISAQEAKRLLTPEAQSAQAERPIAVIGMAGRFGDRDDLDAYWDLIASGQKATRPIASHRWRESDLPAVGGFIDQPDLFDPLFFKISPTEAGLMDPQQRLFLETAWFALENAALGETALKGSSCGVFVGVGAGDYGRRLEAEGLAHSPLALMGNVASILASRIAYLLDLKGPALAVDTACSSSLVAVHLACEALRREECEMAIAGGVCVINSGQFIAAMDKAGVISPSGSCHAFDHRADGFICGEGAGAVVLKPLDRALANGDNVMGVILAEGMNQDGRTNGITAPSAPSQASLIQSVHRRAHIDPDSIGYIETHGTGTPLGDPIEIEALTRAFQRRSTESPPIPLGSVKANIGHTLTAAGIAGLLKVLLMIKAKRIPPLAGFEAPNPRLELETTPFCIRQLAEPWLPDQTGRLIACVSSFGFSGTNAHLVIASPPVTEPRRSIQTTFPFFLSAQNPSLLRQRASDLKGFWQNHPELSPGEFAFTLALASIHPSARTAFTAETREAALSELARVANGELPQKRPETLAASAWQAGEQRDLKEEFDSPHPRKISLPPTRLDRILCAPPRSGYETDAPTNHLLSAISKATSRPQLDLFAEGAAFEAVEHWGRRAALKALAAAGLFAGTRRVITRAALTKEFDVVDPYRGLFNALLELAAKERALTIEGDLIRFDEASVPLDVSALDEERVQLEAEHSAHRPFLSLLSATTFHLPDILRGRRDGTSVLFPEGQMDRVSPIYQGNRLADYFNQLMATAVASAVEMLQPTLEGPIRILEIGAGTGGATRSILEALGRLPQNIIYTYSDVSLGFLKCGRELFGPAIEPVIFDATRPGESQGLGTGTFHILIAANVLHAVPSLQQTLQGLWRLLVPQGLLILNEVTAVQDFATLTFGLTSGWWAFTDPERRLPGAPLADPPRWKSVLKDAGFPEFEVLALPDDSIPRQAILLARRNLKVAVPLPLGPRVTLPSLTPQTPQSSSLSDAPLGRIVVEEVAKTLGVNPEVIDRSGRFMDYGIDSILGQELISRLNQRLGVHLRPTVVFDMPTVVDLARHLSADLGVNEASSVPILPVPPRGTARPTETAAVTDTGPVKATEPPQGEPIAVIGMAGRFASAASLDAFHRLLAEGKSGITLARDRLGIDPDYPPEHLKTAAPYLRWGGLLKSIDHFDPTFFRMSGREAELTDPQHRLFLTDAWRALEDAGYAGSSLEMTECGVFVGCHGGDYTHLMAEKGVVPDAFAFTGNAASILASRIAYLLDLKGPALAVDTACSSSLVAVHLACQALRNDECQMALAGGVFINTTVGFNTAAASAGMLSASGRCAAFDADADGFVPGEGSGVVVLKPLSKALADRDTVIAVIRGSATNQDGKTNGITAPNASSQAALIQKALKWAGIAPRDVQYVETHGTGTRLGDPIEIEGLKRGFSIESSGPQQCLIGSVKTNVGHAAHAAGIAGLIKLLLSYRYNELYPSLHFTKSNPQLYLEETPFIVNTALKPWLKETGPRIAGISSFGFSGTNCHLILADPEAEALEVKPAAQGPVLITLSARTLSALQQQRIHLRGWLENHPETSLQDMAFTLGIGRTHFEHRWAVWVEDSAALKTALGEEHPRAAEPPPDANRYENITLRTRYLEGQSVDFAALYPDARRIPLPTYPFDERLYWIEGNIPSAIQALPETQDAGDMPQLFAPHWLEQSPADSAATSRPALIRLLGDPAQFPALATSLAQRGIQVITDQPLQQDLEPQALTCYLAPPAASQHLQSLEPFLACLKTFLKEKTAECRLLIVHDGAPLFASTIAAAPSLKFLSNRIRLSSLTLPPGYSVEKTADQILLEFGQRDEDVLITAEGQRKVRHMQPLLLVDQPQQHHGGVWLITGGLGGLGPEIATFLAQRKGARIGLLGRSSLNSLGSEKIRNLRRDGVPLHYVSADVSDLRSLNQAIAEIEQRLGPIQNVIHAAGVPSTHSFSESRWADMAATLVSKVTGTLHLDEILAEHPLRQMIFFSSIASEVGDFGQCDYAIANAFLNRFAEWRNQAVARGDRQGRTLSIAWPIWQGGHMALSEEGQSLIGHALGIRPLARSTGITLLEQLMSNANPLSQVLVVMPPKDTLPAHQETPGAAHGGLSRGLPPTSTAAVEENCDPTLTRDRSIVQSDLTLMISRLLKLDPDSLHPASGFGDFGFDSIVLKEFAQEITKQYAIDFSPAVFFAHGSINALATHLVKTYPTIRSVAMPPLPHPSANASATNQDVHCPSEPIAPPGVNSPIALIGLAGRFPGADDLDQFWRLIESGSITVGALPERRRTLLNLKEEAKVQGGFIDDIDQFDPEFFRMSLREAVHMDPQHRLALIATWQALENAALRPDDLKGSHTAVFLGQQISGYTGLLAEADPAATAQAVLGNVNALMPNRISNYFDWHGPSESIDTACSSSLVAVHRAIRALRSGECDLAIAGGTSLLLNLQDLHSTETLGILSPEGRCHTFDARANGYVKGEGIGIVVLKRLEDALRDGDPVHALLLGSAVNHGGRAQSLTAPNPSAQRDLVRAALADAARSPSDLSYVETHGTGTELGDPVEIDALNEVFEGVEPGRVALGALKANIGHLEPASGIAALLKVVLALKHRVIPPIAGLQTINPLIRVADSALTLPREPSAWPCRDGHSPRLAGVSAFGFGGTNAHIIVEEAPASSRSLSDNQAVEGVLLISARDSTTLAAYARQLARCIGGLDPMSLVDIAHTLMIGRTPHALRAALRVGSLAEAKTKLEAFAFYLGGQGPLPDGVIGGNSNAPIAPGSLGTDPNDQAYFKSLAINGQFERLARFWVDGIEIDWAGLPPLAGGGSPARRIHLPSAPLKPLGCWFEPGLGSTKAPAQPDVTSTIMANRPSTPSRPASSPPPLATPSPSPRDGLASEEVTKRIRDLVAGALYIPCEHLDDHARFMDLGLDSILAVEVTRSINLSFEIEIAATRLYDFPSVADLAQHVISCCGGVSASKEPGLAAVIPPSAPEAAAQKPNDIEILETVRTIIAATLYVAPDQLSDDTGFVDLGLDSILAVEVAERLNQALGTDLQATRLYDHPTIGDLAQYLLNQTTTLAKDHPQALSAGDGEGLSFLRQTVALLTGKDAVSIDVDAPLDRLGVTPEQALEILQRIEQRWGIALTPAHIARCHSLRQVSALMDPPPQRPAPLLATSEQSPGKEDAADGPSHSLLTQELAKLLRVPESSLARDHRLSDLGVDRIQAEELASRLRLHLGAAAPSPLTLLSDLSLEALECALKVNPNPEAMAVSALPPPALNLEAASNQQGVAVIGIACRYPGAKNKDAFWQLLREGQSGITRVPEKRWNPEEHLSGLPLKEQQDAVRWGGFIEDIDRFDPLFFNLSPREAELMDPQQRLFLEEAWHAFEDAGLSDQTLKGSRCGIFVGVGQGDYSRRLPSDEPSQITGQFMLGNTSSILVSRIAYLLDLKGPAIAIDTACSSALVATELAFRAIRENRCDIALVGGINLMTTPQMHVMTAASGMLAPDGQCRTFDEGAQGFVAGEGIGLLVLRRLDHARSAGDRIYGLIRGAGINQDGKTSGITAPSSLSQESLERQVWEECQLDPSQLGYIEAHGTATKLGDPIEIDALTRAFASTSPRQSDCPIGSVKTNIGHTLASAGAAGLIKTLLALYHRWIPPSLNFHKPNLLIDFKKTPFFVPTAGQPWNEKRIAGVNSFGFSGTNAHLIVEGVAQEPITRDTDETVPRVFVLSGRDHSGLVRQAESLRDHLHEHHAGILPLDLAHTLALRRSHLEHRLAIMAATLLELHQCLTLWLAGKPIPTTIEGKRLRNPPNLEAIADHHSQPLTDELMALANAWIAGAAVDWSARLGHGQLTDIPGTAFADRRCWYESPPETALSPKAQDRGNTPGVLLLVADDPIMQNHQVGGQPVLPGMASLLLLRNEALQQGFQGPLEQIQWCFPITAPASLTLETERTENRLRLALVTEEGRVAARALAGLKSGFKPMPVELKALQNEFRTEVAPEQIYQRLAARGVYHGKAFQLLQRIQVHKEQILARLQESDPKAFAPLPLTELSPACLDAALQALGALDTPLEGPVSRLLPAGLRYFAMHSTARPVWAWLTVDAAQSGPERMVVDARLLDEGGEVIVEMLGFEAIRPNSPNPDSPYARASLASLRNTPTTNSSAEVAQEKEKAPVEMVILQPVWEADSTEQASFKASPIVLCNSPEAEWSKDLADRYHGDIIRIDSMTPEALEVSVAALPVERPLVFAAWQEPEAPALTPARLIEAERRGLHKLRGLLKGLAQRPSPGRLILVTRGVQCVNQNDRIEPTFASLIGFAQAAARELVGLELACIDLSIARPVSSCRLEHDGFSLSVQTGVFAYREGVRLRQALTRVIPNREEPHRNLILKEGSVCLMVGGAGGLGRATSSWLAQRFKAKIAWVGRRSEDETITAQLSELALTGGEGLYLQADISDPMALSKAIAAVRARWGHINLAWHGSLILTDGSIRTLKARDLDSVMAPKSLGLLNLISALANDPPDRLCLCSSANAYTVNPGQASYAAASTFVDALALAQIQEKGWNVSVINWGIWGETGIVAEPHYLDRARRAGVEPLTTKEALDTFGWALESGPVQIIPLKFSLQAQEELLRNVLVKRQSIDPPAALHYEAAASCLAASFTTHPGDQIVAQAEALSELTRYGRERLFALYSEFGLDQHTPNRLSDLAKTLGVIPSQRDLFKAHLEILARSGWLTQSSAADPWVNLTGSLPVQTPKPPLTTNSRYPLLAAALKGTLEVLTGRLTATDVLFPGGQNNLVEAVYRDDPVADHFNQTMARVVAQLAGKTPLRILEIGGGTGSVTDPVLVSLENAGIPYTYTFTDVSSHFVTAGASRFGHRQTVDFRVLNISQSPQLQGFVLGSYDLIIAANVMHVLPEITQGLRHVKTLLKPDGAALLLEATARSDFATLTFGLTDGWWSPKDWAWRIPHSPLLSTDRWRLVASIVGLKPEAIGHFEGADGQSVLMFSSDGWQPDTPLPLPIQQPKPHRDVEKVASNPATLNSRVLGIVCEVLRIEPDDMDPEEPLERYGVDSLVVNDLHARLEREFGSLSRGVVYEAQTLAQLASRIDAERQPRPLETHPDLPLDAKAIADGGEGAIAIIGIAGQFPGATSVEVYWEQLKQGLSMIGELPAHRKTFWPEGESFPGGYLEDVAGFDSLFFNIAPNEAAAMDPQERLFIETAWSSLENAGRLPSAWKGRVGVFAGVMGRDYLRLSSASEEPGDTPPWSVANRVSYILNLKGPSLAIDTACSSGLSAIHLASASLRQGECDAALAGAVHLILHPASRSGLRALGMLSATGLARPFSCEADGLVGGEGVCCLVLRRLEDALASGDRILGILRSTGLSANGRTRNYMAPSSEGIAEGLLAFQRVPGWLPPDYIECQAMGTPLSDTIVISALAKALSDTPSGTPIGSVEGAIGHLEAVSGLAQMTKVLGMFRHDVLMPTVGSGEIHPDILRAAEDRFEVVQSSRPWPRTEGPRRALVQSLGAGGSSAYALMESPPAHAKARFTSRCQVIPLSAQTAEALKISAQNLLTALTEIVEEELPAMAYTLQTGRAVWAHRLAALGSDRASIRLALDQFLNNHSGDWMMGTKRGAVTTAATVTSDPRQLAQQWIEGHQVDWNILWADEPCLTPIALPTYPFQHRTCWLTGQKPLPKPTEIRPYVMATEPLLNVVPAPSLRKLVVIEGPSEPDDLDLFSEPLKAPVDDEVLIEIAYAGINFADLLCARGIHPNLGHYPHLPGYEVAGLVISVGSNVTDIAPGHRVMALTGGLGGLATHVKVPKHWAVPIPSHFPADLAAATPIGYLTASHVLSRSALTAGETILIQSAAGGTGPFMVQLALEQGARVIATAGTSAKLKALKALGVHHVINYRKDDFFTAVQSLTEGRGVDVVVNSLGGDALQKGIDLLAAGGRYCEIALAGLASSKSLNLSRLTDNQSLITINLGRVLSNPSASAEAMHEMAAALITGRVKPLISRVYAMGELSSALKALDQGKNVGKVLLKPDFSSPSKARNPGKAITMDPDIDLEQALISLAAPLLGLAALELDPKIPLEDYGLNSITATQLMRAIHRSFGIAEPVETLLKVGTIAALAVKLKTFAGGNASHGLVTMLNRSTSHNYDPLVPINGPLGPNVFWVHGAPGDASWILRLTEGMKAPMAFFGLEARGLSDENAPHETVAEMASKYVDALQRQQPEGPYRLGAYSGGGIIAQEMARRLQSQGHIVEKLVLLDAIAPGSSALQGMEAIYDEHFITALAINWFGKSWGLEQPFLAESLGQKTPQEFLDAGLDHLYEGTRPDVERERLAVYIRRMNKTAGAIGHALQEHKALPLLQPVATLLMTCNEKMGGQANPYHLPLFLAAGDYTSGWADFLGCRPQVVNLGCDHFSLLDPPWVDHVQESICRYFNHIEAEVQEPPQLRIHIQQVVEAEVRRVLRLDQAKKIGPNTRLSDLGAHSVDRAEIAAASMEQLNIDLPLNILSKVSDLDGLIDVLADQVAPPQEA